jgi:hypothetical protein
MEYSRNNTIHVAKSIRNYFSRQESAPYATSVIIKAPTTAIKTTIAATIPDFAGDFV